MAVHPGFGGQKMLTDCLEKIKDIKDLIQKNLFDNQINFQIDGGV